MALQINSKYKAKAVSYNSASVKSAKISTLTIALDYETENIDFSTFI